jgi:hypothetical protein
MRELQILILDLAGNRLGELDLTDSDDFALKLTKSIASINDLGRRNTSFSLDFDAPQTKNNNKLLAGLRFITASKEILGQKPCSIIVDGNQVDKGFLYPYESELDGMYKLVFKGLNNDWVEQLRDVELNQLNWRDYKTGLRTDDAFELFDGSRMNTLNTLNSDTFDLTYPAVNRNNSGESADLRPQIHLRSIVLSMFEKIGYTVSSAFLESDWIRGSRPGNLVNDVDAFGNSYEFLGLSVDPGFQLTRDPQDLQGHILEQKSSGITGTDPNTWTDATMMGNTSLPSTPNLRTTFRFPNQLNTLITDDNFRFDPVTSEYTVGLGGTYSLEFIFNSKWAYDVNDSGVYQEYIQYVSPLTTRTPTVTWTIVKNNASDTVIDGSNIIYQIEGNEQNGLFGAFDIDVFNSSYNRFHSFATGDKISLFLTINDNAFGHAPAHLNGAGSMKYWRLRIENDSLLTIVPKEDIVLKDEFRINTHIPEGIKCITLLQDFKTMFNLYFDVDVNRKIVFIEPRDDFYTGIPEEITNIVDSTSAKLNYLTSYKNEIVFRYNADSKDKYLDRWNKINDKTYAEYKYLFQNNERFDKGQSVLSTTILSPSIQGLLENDTNIMSSFIKEEYLDADNLNKPVNQNYAPRVFQLIRGRQYNTANTARRTESPLIVLSAMMENYGNTPTFEGRKLTFIGERGLVWDYYTKTLANIEDTAVLEVKIDLSLHKFNEWDLKKTYYISEPSEIAGYYITDSIKNFNVTKDVLTTITLVKFKDFEPVTVSGGVGNVNVVTQNNPQPEPILCTVNGAIVNCLDNNLQTMFKL